MHWGLEYLRPLIEGYMQSSRPQDVLDFLEEKVRTHQSFYLYSESSLSHSKAIGAARAGNIKEAQEYLEGLSDAYRRSVTVEAAENGYGEGAEQIGEGAEHIYGGKLTNAPDVVRDVLFHAARNGMMDALPSLLGRGLNASTLKIRDDSQYQFAAGFSPFWHAVSAKHFLSRIPDGGVVQMLMPIVERKFGVSVKHDIEEYIRSINFIRNKHTLNYHQAACFVKPFGTEGETRPWNYCLWVSSKTLPSVNRASFKGKVVLPEDVVYRITRFFSPISSLTDREARELHSITGGAKHRR
jgi:hypothetical protein